MRAAVMRQGALVVDEVPDPRPGPGQVVVRTLACGICGSDLHALQHGDQLVEMSAEGADFAPEGLPSVELMDLARDVIMGHEFCGQVVEVGENAGNCRSGDVVVSVPMTFDADGLHPIGYSNVYPGGYAEQLVLSDMVALKVPNGLDPHLAALTEPMAVGLHAVNRSSLREGQAAIVLGCGPVGLATIASLRLLGASPIIAADFSPTRRELAGTMGAHEVTDPRVEPVIDVWRRTGRPQPATIFEAVGVPGLLDQALQVVPRQGEVVVVGACMEPDTFRPMRGVVKEVDIRFAFGYDPMEFSETLRRISEGEIDVAPLVTGRVDLEAVPAAFEELATPDAHAKILVEPA
jgi:2-desacetyl-2-hydroxyethyl bacteriochlorophyllide A dehydrogenase